MNPDQTNMQQKEKSRHRIKNTGRIRVKRIQGVDPDQLASSEAISSRWTLFLKKKSLFTKVIIGPQNCLTDFCL